MKTWLNRGRNHESWLRATDMSGLRSEPTLYYSDDDIRGYQSDLLARANRIDVALRRLASPSLADWTRARVLVTQFTSAQPMGIGGVWAVPRGSAVAPSGLILSPGSNRLMWKKGAAAEKVIENWENVAATAQGTPAPPVTPERSWAETLAEAPTHWVEAAQRAADAPKKAFEDAKPYVIGGGAIVALVALASLAKSVHR
jgi:hypothetical protein